jgi:hypothetical protein
MYSQTIIKDTVREINRKIDALIMAFGQMQEEFKKIQKETKETKKKK